MDLGRVEVRYLRRCDGEVVVSALGRVNGGDLAEAAPVRKPPSYAGQLHYPGVFWSATIDQTLVYESLLELERLWLKDFDRAVCGIATQPMHLSGPDGSVLRRHVPDMFLRHDDGRFTMVDVKPARLLQRQEVRAQFGWTASLCEAKGWRYEVFSGGEAQLLRNIRMVAIGRREFGYSSSILDAVRDVVVGPVTWESAEGVATAQGILPSEVRLAMFRLLWTGALSTDMSRPLSGHSILTPTVER